MRGKHTHTHTHLRGQSLSARTSRIHRFNNERKNMRYAWPRGPHLCQIISLFPDVLRFLRCLGIFSPTESSDLILNDSPILAEGAPEWCGRTNRCSATATQRVNQFIRNTFAFQASLHSFSAVLACGGEGENVFRCAGDRVFCPQ